MLTLALAACAPDTDSADRKDTTTAPYDCGEAGTLPTLTDDWAPASPVSVQGYANFGTAGGWPVYLMSHSTGIWSADSASFRWEPVPIQITHNNADLAINPDDPDQLYRSAGGILERSTDAGQTWTQTPFGSIDPSNELYGLAFAVGVAPWDPTRVYGVLHDGTTGLSTDAGVSFTETGDLPIQGAGATYSYFVGWRILAAPEEGGRILFADESGVYASTDEMASWTQVLDNPMVGTALARDPSNLMRVRAAGFSSEDGGATWEETGPSSAFMAAWGDFLAVATAEGIAVSHDGVNFGDPTPYPDAPSTARSVFSGVHDTVHPGALGVIGDMLLYASPDGSVWASDDEGASWDGVTDGLEDTNLAVVEAHPVCPERVIVGTRCTGGMFLSDDQGEAWTIPAGHYHYVMDVVYDPNDPDRIYSISDESLHRSVDGGISWDSIGPTDAGGTGFHFHGFAAHPENPAVLLLGSVGDGGWADLQANIYRTEDGGTTWTTTTGIPMSDSSAHQIVFLDADTALAGFYRGSDANHWEGEGIGLYRSTDGGVSWTLADLDVLDIAGLEAQEGAVFAATGDGLFRSTDLGVSWEKQEEGWFLSVDLVGQTGLAIEYGGAIWRSDDAGESWSAFGGLDVTDDTTLAQVAVSADELVGYAAYPGEGLQRVALQ